MKKKIVGIIILMLVIATAIPAVTSVKNNAIDATTPKTAQVSMEGIWIETQKLFPIDDADGDMYGVSVFVDGDTAIIGAFMDDDNGDNSGSAYIYTRTGTIWTQQQKLLAADATAGDNFGFLVNLYGDTALIGALGDDDNGIDSGSAYVFTRAGTTWTQQAKLLPSDGAAGDIFGNSVYLDDNTALIGAVYDDDNGGNSGSAYVFTRSGTTWTEQAKLLPTDAAAGAFFGCLGSIIGDTALIGAPGHDNRQGAAYVFTRSGTVWTEQAKLLASDGTAQDFFGYSVNFDGDTALIGTPYDKDNGFNSGSAYVFTRTGTSWTEQAKLLASDGAESDYFGCSLSLDGDIALIGAPHGTPTKGEQGDGNGSAYLFTRSGTTWTQQQNLLASDGAEGDNFGICVSLDGDTALIGSYLDDDLGTNAGSAYVFTKTGLTFSISGGIGVKAVITNDGTIDADDIPWQIHVEGGILGMINKTVNGTIDIPAGKSVTVKTGILLGFGTISIIANVAGKEQTAEGMQILVFSIVKK